MMSKHCSNQMQDYSPSFYSFRHSSVVVGRIN